MAIKCSKSVAEREALQSDLAAHQEKAGQGYQSLVSDKAIVKQSSDMALITFDMMQNLPVPMLTHNSMFYLRQMWVYNLGIHDCRTDTATMCMWNEIIAGRGADEVCSCLLQYILTLPADVKKLICFSDSCFGQNKNFEMICFWNWQVLQGCFQQVNHKFLVKGHTFLPNDCDFSHIEKRKDSAVVYLPSGWNKIVEEACIRKPFTVKPMNASEFYDFSELVKQHTHRKKDSDGKAVLISKATWMNFGQANNARGRPVKREQSMAPILI